MWHYALVLCWQWSGNHCMDIRVLDQDGEFDTLKECQERGLAHQMALYYRPGWQRIVRGSLCTDRPFEGLGPNDIVYETRVPNVP